MKKAALAAFSPEKYKIWKLYFLSPDILTCFSPNFFFAAYAMIAATVFESRSSPLQVSFISASSSHSSTWITSS